MYGIANPDTTAKRLLNKPSAIYLPLIIWTFQFELKLPKKLRDHFRYFQQGNILADTRAGTAAKLEEPESALDFHNVMYTQTY